MRRSDSFQPFRRSLQSRIKYDPRKVKSIKRLQNHLKQYTNKEDKKQTQPSSLSQKQSKTVNKNINNLFNNNIHNSALTHSKSTKQNPMQKKIQALVDSLLLNIKIFNKTFAASKRKKSIIQKIFGWDDIFDEVFFNKYDDDNFKANLTKKSIIQGLNLDKYNFTTKNIYNKLRFFLAELIDLNFRQQQAQCKFQKQRFTESSAKLITKLSLLERQSDRQGTKNQIQKMRNTHVDLFNRKMMIKNRGNELQKIISRTGTINLDKFYLKQQQNIEEVQKFLKSSLIK